MNLLECTKVSVFFGFTKQNEQIFKKKLFLFVNRRNLPLAPLINDYKEYTNNVATGNSKILSILYHIIN